MASNTVKRLIWVINQLYELQRLVVKNQRYGRTSHTDTNIKGEVNISLLRFDTVFERLFLTGSFDRLLGSILRYRSIRNLR